MLVSKGIIYSFQHPPRVFFGGFNEFKNLQKAPLGGYSLRVVDVDALQVTIWSWPKGPVHGGESGSLRF